MNREQVFGIIRHALTFIGGIVVIKGISNEALIEEAIGAIMTAIGAIWSISKNR